MEYTELDEVVPEVLNDIFVESFKGLTKRCLTELCSGIRCCTCDFVGELLFFNKD